MGICFSFLKFFDVCYRQKALYGPMLVLGSQEIHETQEDILSFAEQYSYKTLFINQTVRSLFLDRYGILSYQDCDINDMADIQMDLNIPVKPELVERAMIVLDGGTIEHVFDIRQALRNIHDMTQLNGVIIHISPITWYNHAYYNFNPKLFKAIMAANSYSLIAEAYHFKNNFLNADNVSSPALYITSEGKETLDISDKINQLFSSNLIPANTLYMIAYRKASQREFIPPYDIQQ